MSLKLTSGDQKLWLIGGSILLLLVIAALLLAPPGEATSEVPTTYSTASAGAKAAFLLLAESGYRVQRWEESPRELPLDQDITLIIAGPTELPNQEERARLRAFVATGGHLIAIGSVAATFLPEEKAVPDPLPVSAPWQRYSALTPSPAAHLAPQISMSSQGYWNPKPPVVPLYGEAGKDVVIKYAYGKGDIVWWAGATPLTNAGLKEPGNLEFFLATIGNPQTTRIFWDEYFHGYRRSLAATLAHTQVKWMMLQLALLALFVLLTYSRRSGPVRAPQTESRLSPLEFVDTLGGLYERAGAAAVAVEIYHQRFRYWLTRRLGIASNATVAELEGYVQDRWHFRDPNFSAVLARCESARFDHDLSPKEALRLVQSLHDLAVRFELFPAPKQEKP
jgi:hypothetical protein